MIGDMAVGEIRVGQQFVILKTRREKEDMTPKNQEIKKGGKKERKEEKRITA